MLMEVNSSPILIFNISEENSENYKKIGIKEWNFDRTGLTFEFRATDNRNITIPIQKGEKVKEIIQKIKQTLVDQLPLIEKLNGVFENNVLTDIESQISDNLDKIHKTYFDEQV